MMLALFIARKFRKGRKSNGLLSLVSVISTLNIAIGIAALIIGLSTMNGFEKELKERVLSVIPHGEFYFENQSGYSWKGLQKEINQHKEVVSSAPFISFAALLEKGSTVKAVQIQGVDPAQEAKMSELNHYIKANEWQDFTAKSNTILIGKGLADELGAASGDAITLLIPQNDEYGQLKQPKRVSVTIAGIMNFSGQLGNKVGILQLNDAQSYLNYGDHISGIKVNLTDLYSARHIMNDIGLTLKTPVAVSSWAQNYGYMYNDIQMIRQIMYLAMIIVISVACFSILSTLIIAAKDKQKEIAVLKTLGASSYLISKTFMLYGIISGVIGTFAGVLLGILLSLNLSKIMNIIEILLGRKLLNSHIYFIDFIPSQLELADVIIVFFTAFILTVIASYYPAKRACNIDTVKILNSN